MHVCARYDCDIVFICSLLVKDVTAVMVALQNVTEWTILSILLGVKESTLRRIKEDNKGDSYRAEQAIVEAWIGDTDNPSWAMLVTALKDDLVGMNGIGMKIEQQHLSESMLVPLCMQLISNTSKL